VSIANCSGDLISQKIARRELRRAPIRMAVVATLPEYLEFEGSLLNTPGGIDVVGRTADPLLVVGLVAKLNPDMVLVSIGIYALDVIRALRCRFPKTVVAVVSNAEFASLRTFCDSSDTYGFINKSRFQGDFDHTMTLQFPSRYAPGVAKEFLPRRISHFHFPQTLKHDKEKYEERRHIPACANARFTSVRTSAHTAQSSQSSSKTGELSDHCFEFDNGATGTSQSDLHQFNNFGTDNSHQHEAGTRNPANRCEKQ
jgi:DNA-binding NarL/FixJ family response regulator